MSELKISRDFNTEVNGYFSRSAKRFKQILKSSSALIFATYSPKTLIKDNNFCALSVKSQKNNIPALLCKHCDVHVHTNTKWYRIPSMRVYRLPLIGCVVLASTCAVMRVDNSYVHIVTFKSITCGIDRRARVTSPTYLDCPRLQW